MITTTNLSAEARQAQSMQLGLGPGITVRTRRVSFPIRLGVLPLLGWVEYEQEHSSAAGARPSNRLRTVLVAMAGPVANLLLAFVLGAMLGGFGGGGASIGWDVATAPGRTLMGAVAASASAATPADGHGDDIRDTEPSPGLSEVFEPAGPAELASTVPDPARSYFDWRSLLLWMALMSAVLGTMNLLPFPPLDGGVILCQFLPRPIGMALSLMGTILLGIWTVAVLFADIV